MAIPSRTPFNPLARDDQRRVRCTPPGNGCFFPPLTGADAGKFLFFATVNGREEAMPDRAPIQPLGRRTTYHQNLRCADAIWDFCGFLAQVKR